MGVGCLNPGSVSILKDGSYRCKLYNDGEFTLHILVG